MKLLRCVALACLLPASAMADSFAFALIGDLPYGNFERQHLPDLLAEIGREDLAFVVHDGDIKRGSSVCSDEVFRDIRDVFNASRHPLVFVPGDNEWTDCHRSGSGGYDPLERLQKLRQIFHDGDSALGQRALLLERQSRDARFAAYRENVRWRIGPVLFIGMNVPGSNNNWGRDARPSAEHVERSRANRAWLSEAFAMAREGRLAGLMIVIQANPGLESAKQRRGRPNGYLDFIEQLRAESRGFNGQVVLVHGDTHFHRIDKPLHDPASGETIMNFTRVETFGSPFMGWVKATFDSDDPAVFRFESRPYTPAR